MPARFRIKRSKPFEPQEPYPWKMVDASRPAFLGQYATHALALAAVDAKIRAERGLAPRLDITPAEVREAMSA